MVTFTTLLSLEKSEIDLRKVTYLPESNISVSPDIGKIFTLKLKRLSFCSFGLVNTTSYYIFTAHFTL